MTLTPVMQLRQLLEEQARLQNENQNFRSQVDTLQAKANEAADLRADVRHFMPSYNSLS